MHRLGDVRFTRRSILLLFLLVLPTFLLSTSVHGEGASHQWMEIRHDGENTGHVDGHGLVNYPVPPVTVEEPGGIVSNVLSVDLNGDGVNDLVYGTGNGSYIVREGPYSDPTVVENVVGLEGTVFPVVYNARPDSPLMLLLLVSSSDNSSILFLEKGSRSVTKRIDVTGTLEDDWKVLDADRDGNNELIVTTFQGTVISVDLEKMEADWSRFVARGLTEPLGFFEHGGSPKLALTSGISFNGWEKIGSKDLYILNGTDGSVDRVVRESEEILATPPSIYAADGRVYVSYCNYTGALFIYEYSSGEMYDTVEREVLVRPPYWKHVNIVTMPGHETVYLVFQGDRYVLVYDLSSREIVWTDNINYEMEFNDSLVADINNDGRPELLLLRMVHYPWTSTLRVKTVEDGTLLQEIQLDVPDSRSLLISDMDGDGYLEVCVVSPRHLAFIDRDEHVDMLGAKVDGAVMKTGSKVPLYSMYRTYDLSFEVGISSTAEHLLRMVMVIDPSGSGLLAEIDLVNGTLDPPVTEHVILDEASVHLFGNVVEIDVRLLVNWSFPHEDPFPFRFEVEYGNHFSGSVDSGILFRVENDISIVGDLGLSSNGTTVQPGEWLNSQLPIRADGVWVAYQDSPGVLVDASHFTIESRIGDLRSTGTGQDDGSFVFDIDVSGLMTGTYPLQVLLTRHPGGVDVDGLSLEVRIDAETVRIVSLFPSYGGWHSSRDLLMGLVVSDNNGSGVDPGSIQMRLGTIDAFNVTAEWESVSGVTVLDIGDGFTLIGVEERLDSGIYLYQWRLSDLVHHGYARSMPVELRVDFVEVEFLDPSPGGWVNTTPFETEVTIRFGSPYTITRSHVQYSVWDPPGGREWNDMEIPSGENSEVRASGNATAKEGSASFIQWRVVVDDGTVHYSGEHRLFVDTTSPRVAGVTPDLSALFNTHTFNVTVEIVDDGSGIDQDSIGVMYTSNDRITSWLDHEATSLSAHRAVISFVVENVHGKSNQVVVVVTDMAGNRLSLDPPLNIDVNEPPVIEVVSPKNESVFRPGASVVFSVEANDPDGESLTILWRSDMDGPIGTGATLDIRNLSLGTHEITVTVVDEGSNSANSTVVVHVETGDDGEPGPRVTGGNLVLISALIIILVLGLVLLMHRRNR